MEVFIPNELLEAAAAGRSSQNDDCSGTTRVLLALARKTYAGEPQSSRPIEISPAELAVELGQDESTIRTWLIWLTSTGVLIDFITSYQINENWDSWPPPLASPDQREAWLQRKLERAHRMENAMLSKIVRLSAMLGEWLVLCEDHGSEALVSRMKEAYVDMFGEVE